jgi:hypothetical protein
MELEEEEKEILVKAYKILEEIYNDMWHEDLEDTEEAFKVDGAKMGLESLLYHLDIDYVD